MSLKTDYLDGATGLSQAMANVFLLGSELINNNLVIISDALKENAALCKRQFTINLIIEDANAQIRVPGVNLYRETYIAGITYALSGQDIYEYECTPVVDISVNTSTSINLNFTL